MKMEILYLSTETCNVCKSLKPKVIELIESYSDIDFKYINITDQPEASGIYSVFAVPTIIFFVDEKEYFRESRFVSIDSIKEKIDRIIEFAEN